MSLSCKIEANYYFSLLFVGLNSSWDVWDHFLASLCCCPLLIGRKFEACANLNFNLVTKGGCHDIFKHENYVSKNIGFHILVFGFFM